MKIADHMAAARPEIAQTIEYHVTHSVAQELTRRGGIDNWKMSVDLCTQQLEKNSTLTDGERVGLFRTRGLGYRMLNQHRNAESDFLRGWKFAGEQNLIIDQFAIAGDLIDVYRTGERNTDESRPFSKDMIQALAWSEKAIELFHLLKEPPHPGNDEAWNKAKIQTSFQIGLLSAEQKHYPQALEWYTPALSTAVNLVDHFPHNDGYKRLYARGLTITAVALENNGLWGQSLILQKEALTRYKQQWDIRGMGNALYSLGKLHVQIGDSESAFSYFERAFLYCRQNGKVLDPDMYTLISSSLNELRQSYPQLNNKLHN